MGHCNDQLRMQEHSRYCIGCEGRNQVEMADNRKSLKRPAQVESCSVGLLPAEMASDPISLMNKEEGTQLLAGDHMDFDQAIAC